MHIKGRLNDLYQRLFVCIMEICFKFGSEKLNLGILLKLGLLTELSESFESILKNDVIYSNIPVESLYYFQIQIVKAIEVQLWVRTI